MKLVRRGLLLLWAAPSWAAYQYYSSDTLTWINPATWYQNGVLSATASGLTSQDPNGGSLISKIPVPDGTADYEISTTLQIGASGGSFQHFLRATPDARSGPAAAGTFYSIEFEPTVSGGNCSANVSLKKRDAGGTVWLVASTVACCAPYALPIARMST